MLWEGLPKDIKREVRPVSSWAQRGPILRRSANMLLQNLPWGRHQRVPVCYWVAPFREHDRAPCVLLPRVRISDWGNRAPQRIHSRLLVKLHPAARQAKWRRPIPRKLAQKPFRPMPRRVPRRPITRASRLFRPASYAQGAERICDGSPNMEPVIRCNPPMIAVRGAMLARPAPVPVEWIP